MRRKRNYKKYHNPDAKYQSVAVYRFINYLMEGGKKEAAKKVLYNAFDIIEKNSKENPMLVFEKALENASPLVEVMSKRVGGANYQVPREVRIERKFMLATR